MNPGQTQAANHALVSIIVRSMDRPTLAHALQSVAAQTWPAIEVLVVNALGAAHKALEPRCGAFALKRIDGDGPMGRSRAANAGLAAASGRWICFLDDDDWFDPGHVASLAARLGAEPDAVAAYSGVSCVEADPDTGELREVIRYNLPFDATRLLCENYLPIHSVLFAREAVAKGATFDESLAIFEDWDFWIQLSRQGGFAHVDQVTATYRLGSGDSGLYGNTELQEEFAGRILRKWSPSLTPADWDSVWRLGRRTLHSHDAAQRHLAQARTEIAELQKSSRELQSSVQELRSSVREQSQVRQKLEESLRGVTREYEQAYALLRREQLTVVRPIARHLKRVLRAVWRRLPAGLQRPVRRMLARPLQEWKPAQGAGGLTAQQWRDAIGEAAPGTFTAIVFPVIDWHFRIQRPQHLARELAAQGHRVIYLSTTFASGPAASGCRLLGSPAPNVHLVQLPVSGAAPNIYEDLPTPEQVQELTESLVWLQQSANLGATVSLVNLPFWRSVARSLPANVLVYDCMDFHAGFSTNTGRMLQEEEALLRDCDLLLTTSVRLSELMQAKAPGKPHALIRNGTEVAHFATAPALLKLERDGRPVIGYFGAISEWFDISLLVAVARSRPDWRFVLVGATTGCDVSQAQRVPNIEFTGEVPYAELPGWVHAFDVCIIPFILNELTRCTNPVKVYEYLSAGKPVVATRLPELEVIEDQVYLAQDATGFAQQLDRALADSRSGAHAAARTEWAGGHSWRSRAQSLTGAIDGLLPKVSAIVLCYNNLALTQACLASVERNSHWPDLELILVDNASSDGTPDYLREFAATRPWVKLVLNDKNLGFAAGNNTGLAVATGDILVMLNNDTQVSPGWVHGLWRHFQHDPALGMVGPVTNNIGNEAKVDVAYIDPLDMPAWAAMHTSRHAGERIECRVLAFFCVALRRTVYEEVGGLDEAFGLGFFEDDDYCNRARLAGWQLAVAEDVFVHHHLSASFDQLGAARRKALFDKNREIYESKWGPWVPHQYRPAGSKE